MILGVSGAYAAGKGEAVAFLEGRGFEAYSLSDVIRDELHRQPVSHVDGGKDHEGVGHRRDRSGAPTDASRHCGAASVATLTWSLFDLAHSLT